MMSSVEDCAHNCSLGSQIFCVNSHEVCDRRLYHCPDRSDENHCLDLIMDESHCDRFNDLGVEAGLDIAWTLIFIIVGVPVVYFGFTFLTNFLIKHFRPDVVRGSSDDANNAQEDAEDDEIVSDTTDDIIDFVLATIDYVLEDESRAVQESKSYTLERGQTMKFYGSDNLGAIYRRIHDRQAWQSMAALILDMGYLFFEGDVYLIDKYHITIHVLEKFIHDGDDVAVDLCLKQQFGNRQVSKILWSSEPPCIRTNVYSRIPWPSRFKIFLRSHGFRKSTVIISLVLEGISNYKDFIKDVLVVIIVGNFISRDGQGGVDFFKFEGQIYVLMIVLIIIPELIKGFYFATMQSAILFSIGSNPLSWMGSMITGLLLIITAPLVPAFMLIRRAMNNLRMLVVEQNLANQLEGLRKLRLKTPPSSNNQQKKMLGQEEDDLRRNIDTYLKLNQIRKQNLRMVTLTKQVEANTETFYQFIIQLIIVLTSSYLTAGAACEDAEGLLRIFFNQTLTSLLYLSLAVSFVSMVASRVGIEMEYKEGFFPDMAKIFYGAHVLVSLLVRTLAVVVFFAPPLALFGFDTHYKSQMVPFEENILMGGVPDPEGSINYTSWNEMAERSKDYINDYALLSLETSYILYLTAILPLCFMVLYGLKSRYFITFAGRNSRLSKRIMHVANCMVFPSIFTDWDDDASKHWCKVQRCSFRKMHFHPLDVYAKRWSRLVKYEHIFMIVWHAVINFIHCIPLFYTGAKILAQHSRLLEMGFAPLDTEVAAYNATVILMSTGPLIFLVIAPVLQAILLYLYYNYGHPWSRIFAFFNTVDTDEVDQGRVRRYHNHQNKNKRQGPLDPTLITMKTKNPLLL